MPVSGNALSGGIVLKLFVLVFCANGMPNGDEIADIPGVGF